MIKLFLHACRALAHLILLRESVVLLVLVSAEDRAINRVQVVHHLVQLLDKYFSLSFAKVRMIVATKLVVAEDQVANLVHHPLDLSHGANFVCIAIKDSDRHVTDPVNRNVCCDAL